MKAIQRFGPQGAIFVPDIISMAENKENLRSVERMLRRFERSGPDVRSLPELVKQLDHKQDSVRLLAIKFLRLAGPSAKDALPALEQMRDDPSAEVRKQAEGRKRDRSRKHNWSFVRGPWSVGRSADGWALSKMTGHSAAACSQSGRSDHGPGSAPGYRPKCRGIPRGRNPKPWSGRLQPRTTDQGQRTNQTIFIATGSQSISCLRR